MATDTDRVPATIHYFKESGKWYSSCEIQPSPLVKTHPWMVLTRDALCDPNAPGLSSKGEDFHWVIVGPDIVPWMCPIPSS